MFNKKSRTKDKLTNHNNNIIGIALLLGESRRLLKESKIKDLSIDKQPRYSSAEIEEIFNNLSEALNNHRQRVQFNLLK